MTLQPGGMIRCRTSVAGSTGVFSELVTTPQLWHHVGCVLDAGRLQIFIDGVPGPLVPAGLASTDGSDPVQIGQDAGDSALPSRNLIGRLDDVRIWSRALSADELRLTWERGAGP